MKMINFQNAGNDFMTEIKWYFDFISPFAYLQMAQFSHLPKNIKLKPIPVVLRVHYRACIKDAGGKTDKKVRGGRRGRCGVAAPHRGGRTPDAGAGAGRPGARRRPREVSPHTRAAVFWGADAGVAPPGRTCADAEEVPAAEQEGDQEAQ